MIVLKHLARYLYSSQSHQDTTCCLYSLEALEQKDPSLVGTIEESTGRTWHKDHQNIQQLPLQTMKSNVVNT